MKEHEEREVVKKIAEKRGKSRVVLHDGQHVYYPNFTRFGFEQVGRREGERERERERERG